MFCSGYKGKSLEFLKRNKVDISTLLATTCAEAFRLCQTGLGEAVMAESGSKEPEICRVDAVKPSDGIYVPIT